MKAKFAGSCISCGQPIKPGKEISKNNEGSWVHSFCAEDADLP
jgi:hypothetical protein